MKPIIQIFVLLLLPVLLFCQNVPDSIIIKSRIIEAEGSIKFYGGYNSEGLKLLNEAIKLYSKNDGAFFTRGQLKASIGDFEGALNDFKTAIFLNPNETHYYWERAFFLENQMGDYKGALSDYTKTIELDSKRGFYYLCRGDVKIKLKDVAGACNDFRKAYELGEIEGFDKIKSHCK